MKPIVFLVSGTRGDVQPIASLARGLQDAGHVIRLAAPPAFRDLVESLSIPFMELQGNPSDLLTIPGRQSALTFNDNPLRNTCSVLEFMRAARPMYSQMITNGWKVSQGASAIVIGLPTIWGTSIAESLKITCIGAFLQPVTPTVEFPSSLWPTSLRLGSTYNRLTYWLSARALFIPWRSVINSWRRQTLGLKTLSLFHDPFNRLDAILYGFSECVVPAPADWKSGNFITGYWEKNMGGYSPPEGLRTFLESGNPPFYFGFGSPGMSRPGLLIEIICSAIERSKIRAVISLPREFSHLVVQSPDIHILMESIPHTWLFPQMAGVIHHGGAGTTAAALTAGVPSLITPLAVDQFFWGDRVHALGASPPPIPQRSMTVETLVEALRDMHREEMNETAHLLGEKLRREQGIRAAVRRLEALLETGQIHRSTLRRGG